MIGHFECDIHQCRFATHPWTCMTQHMTDITLMAYVEIEGPDRSFTL